VWDNAGVGQGSEDKEEECCDLARCLALGKGNIDDCDGRSRAQNNALS